MNPIKQNLNEIKCDIDDLIILKQKDGCLNKAFVLDSRKCENDNLILKVLIDGKELDAKFTFNPLKSDGICLHTTKSMPKFSELKVNLGIYEIKEIINMCD